MWHHGSQYASTPAFIADVRPRVAIISVGRHNAYGHPAPATLARLERGGAATYRTALCGAVTLSGTGAPWTCCNANPRRRTVSVVRLTYDSDLRNEGNRAALPTLPTRTIPKCERTALRRLVLLSQIRSLEDLKSPGFRREALQGRRRGQYSIRINDQWRICFRWEAGDAHDVEIVDYH